MPNESNDVAVFTRTAIILTLLTVTAAAWAKLLHLPWPYSSPLFRPGFPLGDLLGFIGRFHNLHTAAFYFGFRSPFNYLPPGIWLYRGLYSFGALGAVVLYFALAVGAVLWSLDYFQRQLRRNSMSKKASERFIAILTLAASYPVVVCFQHANLEILLAAGVGVGIWAYWTGKPLLAVVLWGLLGSVKLYPLVLLALPFSERKFRETAIGVCSALGSLAVSLYWAGPDVKTAWHGTLYGLSRFMQMFALSPDRALNSNDHSLFAVLKAVSPAPPTAHLLHAYIAICFVLALAIYVLRARSLPILNQLLLVTIAMVVLPPTSFDYTLVQLYVPFGIILVRCDRKSANAWTQRALLALFALVFAPTNFLFHNGIAYSAQLKCVALLAMATIALVFPLVAAPSLPQKPSLHRLPTKKSLCGEGFVL
jgi:hypothetical protein